MSTFPSAFLSDLSSHTDNTLLHRDWSWCLRLVFGMGQEEKGGKELWGTRCSDKDRGGGGLVGVIKEPDHQTYTQAVHGVTNHSVYTSTYYLVHLPTTYPKT